MLSIQIAPASAAEVKLHPMLWDVSSMPPRSCSIALLLSSATWQLKVTGSAQTHPPSTIPTIMDETSDLLIWNTLTTASRTTYSTPNFLLHFDADNIPSISLED
ncbi:hypothetical protein B0H14DRAFT_2466945 [Mycena olivaceomarginata]|nr:hypothetical protein B0H14DRAFT_2466945 [Mycena olivaceomarginata]